MGRLERTIFGILSSFPENTLHTDAEVWCKVREMLPLVRRDDFARTMCEVGRRHGLIGGLFERGYERLWGFALRSKITEMPSEALCIIGAKLKSRGGDPA
mgnify:CR=1 FL=1